MNRKTKQFICLLLALCMFASVASAFAYDGDSDTAVPQTPYRFSHINEIGASIDDVSWLGKFSCFASVELTHDEDTADLTLYLQRAVDGVWTTVTSWTVEDGTDYVAMERSLYVTSGYYYSVLSVANVYHNGKFVEYASVRSLSEYY